MNLPEEIRNKEFSTGLRGYKIQEVEDYIELLLEKYDKLYNENTALADKLTRLAAENEEIRQKAQKTEEEARLRAEEIIAEARATADKEVRLAESAIKGEVRKAIERAEEEKRAAAAEVALQKTRLQELKNEYAALRSSCEDLRAERDTVRAQRTLLAGETSSLRGEKAALEKAKNALLDELAFFRTRLQDHTARLNGLLPREEVDGAVVPEQEPEPAPEPEEDLLSGTDGEADAAGEEDAGFGSLSRELKYGKEPEGTREISFDFGRAAGETIPPVKAPGEDAAPQKKNGSDLFSAGLKVTREPVGQASRERRFEDVRERLEKAMPTAAEQTVKPQKFI